MKTKCSTNLYSASRPSCHLSESDIGSNNFQFMSSCKPPTQFPAETKRNYGMGAALYSLQTNVRYVFI
jgi:hypothetical protein